MFKLLLAMAIVIVIAVGVTGWVVGGGYVSEPNDEMLTIVFGLMVFYLIILVAFTYLILEIIRLFTLLQWSIADRSTMHLCDIDLINDIMSTSNNALPFVHPNN